MGTKPCKDCPPDSKRPAPNPGPRCATHWRAERKRRSAASHARHLAKTYGLEVGEYEAILEHQGGRCAICQRATGRTRRLSVDHDHATGLVRGLLCRPCNDMLGHGRDDPPFFRRAADYLEQPPAPAAGVHRGVPA